MDRLHNLVFFPSMYPVEKLSECMIDRIPPTELTGSEFNSILMQFVGPKESSKEISSGLLQRDPMIFLVSYMIMFHCTKNLRYIHAELGERCHAQMLDLACSQKGTIDSEELQYLLSKNLPFRIEGVKNNNGQLTIPLEYCLEDMVGFVDGFLDYNAIISPGYLDYKLNDWINDGIFEINRISSMLFKENPNFIDRGDEFNNALELLEKEKRREVYSKIPYEDKLIFRRFNVIYKALSEADLLNIEVTCSKVIKALENYIPENDNQQKHIAYLLNRNCSEKTINKLQKKHSNEDSNIHKILSSNLVKTRVRIKKGRWLKYVVYKASPKIKLETFEDLERLMMFPCMERIFREKGAEHTVLAAFFSVLLWFYTKNDCHYILKSIVGMDKYNYTLSEYQFASLLGEDEKPIYLYGPSGFKPFCEDYKKCQRCWISALDFPGEYYQKKNEKSMLNRSAEV